MRFRVGSIRACGAAILALALWGATRVEAEPAPLVHLDDLGPRQVKSQSFIVGSAQDIQIEAVGAESVDKNGKSSWMGAMWERNGRPVPPWTGNAWILDLQSRKVVWELSEATTTEGSHGLRTFKGNVHLSAGSYTAYYASFPDGEYWSEDGKKTAPDRKWHWFGNQTVQDFKLILRGDGRALGAAERDRLRGLASSSTIVALHGSSPQAFEQAGFAISKPTEIQIDAVGEAREDGEFDFAWIVNADTRAPVWRFTYRDSQPAGGAPKNRAVTTSQLLPAGRYAVFYATDDSHDPSEWNAQPPHDPEAWGVTLRVKDESARAAVKTFDYELVPASATIVALTKVGNSASKKQGFTLTRPMDLRIYALGEGRGGRMFDYGWITSDESHKRVWTMEYDGTEPAGGDRKNRIVDTTVHLEKGSYVVHYVTDDSHSAEEWNAPAPPDAQHWGITVLAAHLPLDRSAIAPYAEKNDASIVAQLVGVRDDEQVRQPFSLDRETDVRIYAIGEGTHSEMVDYGWIEDAKTGRRVWEMTYRVTEHAGGANKNRRFDGVIRLPAGNYVLRFETDGSHSFGDWNAAPPDDPEAYGITVYRVK